MRKGNYPVFFVCFLVILAWIGSVQAQQMKTDRLASGEKVLNICGDWDQRVECYGPWSELGSYSNVVRITMEGKSFIGVRMKFDPGHYPDSEAIRGKLDENGIQKVQIISSMDLAYDAKAQISEDGNKIIIDDGEKVRYILTRK